MNGTMVVSLDFELMWGVLDKLTIKEYGDNILQGRKAIEKILKLFKKYQIHATWAVVGLIYMENFKDLEKEFPDSRPNYRDKKLSSYYYLPDIKDLDENYFFAKDLIYSIAIQQGQEVASHTFSHYYCKEEGQNIQDFERDIKKAVYIAKENGNDTKSIVFPRNQENGDYRKVLLHNQIRNYRGNEKGFCYKPSNDKSNTFWKRGIRLVDAYLNLTGHQCYDYVDIPEQGLNNIRSSRFLRPYCSSLFFLEPLRIFRIKRQMRYAAKHGKVFHIWWHPHNFGKNIERNIEILDQLLKFFLKLNNRYGFQTMNMQELGRLCDEGFDISR